MDTLVCCQHLKLLEAWIGVCFTYKSLGIKACARWINVNVSVKSINCLDSHFCRERGSGRKDRYSGNQVTLAITFKYWDYWVITSSLFLCWLNDKNKKLFRWSWKSLALNDHEGQLLQKGMSSFEPVPIANSRFSSYSVCVPFKICTIYEGRRWINDSSHRRHASRWNQTESLEIAVYAQLGTARNCLLCVYRRVYVCTQVCVCL